MKSGDWETVVVNISGKEFRTRMRHLRRYPNSRLGKIAMATSRGQILSLCDGYIPGQPPIIFFYRNPQNFQGQAMVQRDNNNGFVISFLTQS